MKNCIFKMLKKLLKHKDYLSMAKPFEDVINWDEWVAVKKSTFIEPSPNSKLIFILAWNENENKVAITCKERHRVAKDDACFSQIGLFSLEDLKYVHYQLCLIHPSLDSYLPNLPVPSRTLWGYVSKLQVPPDLCVQIENYLKAALDICGRTLLIHVLFDTDSDDDNWYMENISELREKGYEDAYIQAEKELVGVLETREKAENMLHMTAVYSLEDEVVNNINIALAEYYNFKLQPFVDLREIAYEKLQSSRSVLENPDVGQRIKDENKKLFNEWQQQYAKTIDAIRELYIEYYSKTTKIIADQKNRMLEDQTKFGKSTFEVFALSRLDEIELMYHREKLKIIQSKCLQKEHERHKIEQQLMVISASNMKTEIERKEAEIYSYQIVIFDLKLKMLSEEEALLKKLISIHQRGKNELKEIGIFYDAVENESDLEDMEESTDKIVDPKEKSFKDKLAVIFRKRALLRSKQNACIAAWEKKIHEKENKEVNFKKHHSVQLKRDNTKKEEEQKKQRIEKERRLTVQRLKEYKKRYPTPAPLQPALRLTAEEPTSLATFPGQKSDETVGLSEISWKKNKPTEVKQTPVDQSNDSVVKTSNMNSETCRNDINFNSSSSSQMPCPPPPPSPSLFVPPPPPPPPPLPSPSSSLNSVHPVLKRTISRDHVANSAGSSSTAVGSLDFAELLAQRGKLRKVTFDKEKSYTKHTDMIKEMINLRACSQGKQNDGSLLEKDVPSILYDTLERIRKVTAESDESDSSDSDNNEFD